MEDFGETSRRLILTAIKDRSRTVNEIVAETGLKQPNVSNHLARMRLRGVVKALKTGRKVYYSLASSRMQSLVSSVVSAREHTGAHLDYSDLCERLYQAAIEGDEELANTHLNEAFEADASLLDIYDLLLAPMMRRVGVSYDECSIDEGQEHVASEITLRLMARTVSVPGPAKRIGKSAVVACVPNDYHTIGARMAADYLRLCGWKTLFCGGNVPIRSLLSAVFREGPDLVLLGCSISSEHEATLQLLRELNYLRQGQKPFFIGVGGNLPPAFCERLRLESADFVCMDLRQFAKEILPSIEKTGKVPSYLA